MTRLRTIAACHESAARDMIGQEWGPRGIYYDRLPTDTCEDKATQLWRLACHFEVADPYVIELNREALAEAHARLGAVLGEG